MLVPLLSYAEGWDEAKYKQIEQSIKQPQISGKDYDITKFGAKPDASAAANQWADKVEACFARDAALHHDFNKVMAGGKWDGMMIQKHIGYTNWNDNFPADRLPRVQRIETPTVGGFSFPPDKRGFTAIEAEHYNSAAATDKTNWTTIP